MVYVPAGAVRLKVPSPFATMEATSAPPVSYKPTAIGLPASTCPVTVPSGLGVAVGDEIGVGVAEVGVGDSTGVDVKVGVGDSSGVDVSVGVTPGSRVEVSVGVPPGSGVEVSVGVPSGSDVDVAVGDESGSGVEVSVGVAPGSEVDVGDSKGVGVEVNVAVGAIPIMVRLAAVDGRAVRILSPFETRAVHSMVACPACRALALKVNAGPLVVALLPLLPAMATMKVPFCGSLIAAAASAPKRPPTTILLTCTKPAL